KAAEFIKSQFFHNDFIDKVKKNKVTRRLSTKAVPNSDKKSVGDILETSAVAIPAIITMAIVSNFIKKPTTIIRIPTSFIISLLGVIPPHCYGLFLEGLIPENKRIILTPFNNVYAY